MKFHAQMVVGACALVVGHVACAGGSTLSGRPGLWAEASVITMNGARMPGLLDLEGGLPAEEVGQIRQAMKTLGLPDDWDPKLVCLTRESFDVDVATQKAAGACPSPSLVIKGNTVSYQASCVAKDAQSLKVVGELSVAGETEMTHSSRQEALVRGLTVVTEARSVSRWLGPDCNRAPAVIKPAWMQTLNER